MCPHHQQPQLWELPMGVGECANRCRRLVFAIDWQYNCCCYKPRTRLNATCNQPNTISQKRIVKTDAHAHTVSFTLKRCDSLSLWFLVVAIVAPLSWSLPTLAKATTMSLLQLLAFHSVWSLLVGGWNLCLFWLVRFGVQVLCFGGSGVVSFNPAPGPSARLVVFSESFRWLRKQLVSQSTWDFVLSQSSLSQRLVFKVSVCVFTFRGFWSSILTSKANDQRLLDTSFSGGRAGNVLTWGDFNTSILMFNVAFNQHSLTCTLVHTQSRFAGSHSKPFRRIKQRVANNQLPPTNLQQHMKQHMNQQT